MLFAEAEKSLQNFDMAKCDIKINLKWVKLFVNMD